MNVVLLVREKLRVLETASEESPGLFTKVLGIQERKFNEIAGIGWPTLIQTRLWPRASTLPESPRIAEDTQAFY
jgi:hypothetical protein